MDFDFDAAYLQGHYVDRRVFARAPLFLRKYDERGVTYVWQLSSVLSMVARSGELETGPTGQQDQSAGLTHLSATVAWSRERRPSPAGRRPSSAH